VTIHTTAANVTSWNDTTVSTANCYDYKIIAVNACGDSAGSVAVNECTTCDLPIAPATISLTGTSNTTVDVAWASVAGATSYKIERRTPPASFAQISTTTGTSITNSGLTSGTEYCYRVRGVNGCGNGAYSIEPCITTTDYPECGTVEQTFSYSRARQNEPGYFPAGTNASAYMAVSPSGEIDLSNPAITKVVFAGESDLDDILIMVKPSESVVVTYPMGSSAGGRGPIHVQMPNNCIMFGNTFGFQINGQTLDGAVVKKNATLEKVFDETGTSNTHTIVAGKPPGSPANGGTGTMADFASAGFTVVEFSDGIDKSLLSSKGFIDGDGIFAFKFYHIICGIGHVTISNMTCLDSSSSSSGCTTPNAPSVLSGATNGVEQNRFDLDGQQLQ
jgi:hypothetical protein